MDFWDTVKLEVMKRGETQEWLANKIGANINTFRGWISKGRIPDVIEAVRIADTLNVSLDLLAGREFLVPSGKTQPIENFDIAQLVPQKVSAGAGQAFLDYAPDELIQRAPYPQSWGKGLLAVEVMGDSMTGVQIFDGDIVYFKPGEVRADGLYVLQLNGGVFVKRLSFDQINRKIIITSENSKYPQVTEPLDSQAVTILGKVKGWLHEHPY